ncbi:MAG: hypothetical protein E6Q24_05525 [Chitinophagaceae bacterium]|nr:MAG: hypothetical protein E6Q24_05525 [Chitinophagaceae bacterium]
MITRVKKRYDIEITQENAVHSKTFELDKNIIKVHGLLLESDRDDFLFYRGFCKIEINRQEIFPEGYAAKLLLSGVNVSPNDRYYKLGGLEPGNGQVRVEFKDNAHILLAFANYRVSLYLDCEITELQ